jgi:predicted metal-dependent peptidase
MYFGKEDRLLFEAYRKRILEQEEGIEDDEVLDPQTYKSVKWILDRAKDYVKDKDLWFYLRVEELKITIVNDSSGITTMAVDDYGNMYISWKFVIDLCFPYDEAKGERVYKPEGMEEIAGVLAHEAYHTYSMHFYTLNGRNHTIWNIATDYIMNRDLIHSGFKLPSLGCIPVKKGDAYFIPKVRSQLTGKVLLKDVDITHSYRHPGRFMGEAELYDILWDATKDDRELMEQLQKLQQELDKHLTDEQKKELAKRAGKGKPGQAGITIPSAVPTNDPNYPGGREYGQPNDPGNKTKAEKEADMQASANNADQKTTSQLGAGHGGPRGEIKVSKPKLDWRRILKDYLKPARIKTSTSWAKGFQTRALTHRGLKPRKITTVTKLENLIVAVDTSGSIGGSILNTFISEIYGIINAVPEIDLHILFWTTVVYKDFHIKKTKKGEFGSASETEVDEAAPKGGTSVTDEKGNEYKFGSVKDLLQQVKTTSGGTTMSSVADYCDSHNIKNIGALIYFTDGEVENNPKVPRVSGGKPIIIINSSKDDPRENPGQNLTSVGIVKVVEVEHS